MKLTTECADEATCAAIKAQYKWHDKMGFDEALRYKYTLDVYVRLDSSMLALMAAMETAGLLVTSVC